MSQMYTDLTHTLFPTVPDDSADHPYMQDAVSSQSLLAAATSYNAAINDGNAYLAQQILDANEELQRCLFNAEKYNWMRDAIIACQRYYVNDVETYITALAANTIGIDDTNSQGSPGTNGYSITKINSLVSGTSSNITLDSSSWSGDSAPYTYTINLAGVTTTNMVDVSLSSNATLAQAKAWAKTMVMNATQSTGQVVLKAYGKKPSINIPITVTVHA